MTGRGLLGTLSGSALALVAACELVVGIKDRPRGGGLDGAAPDGATSPSSADATQETAQDSTGRDDATDDTERTDATGDAAERDGASDSEALDAGYCSRSSPPSRPAMEDGTQNLVLQLAVRTVDLGIRLDPDASAPPPPTGYNLDGLLSCPDQPCIPRTATAPICDGGCGIDNAATPLFQTFGQSTNGRFNQQAFNDQLSLGGFGLLFRVRYYNGGANDKQVEVAIFDSDGTVPDEGGSTQHIPPRWDGSDVWTLDSKDVLAQSGPSANPAYIQIDAYVADHVLVAQIDRPIRLYGGAVLGTLVFQTVGTTITGTLTPDGNGTFRIDDGLIAGRWPTKYIASGLAAVPDPVVDGGYLCASSATSSYPIIARIICKGADITADPRAQGLGSTCDAVSFGIGMTASAALMGPVSTRPLAPTSCPDAGLENCSYP